MSVTRKWSLLAAVLAMAVLAAGWFLLISPKRDEAADLRSQADTQDAANARLVQELEILKAQQAELPEQRALLASYRKQIPDNPALPSLIRDLTEAGRKVGVSVDSMAPSFPEPQVVLDETTPVAPTTTSTSEGSTTSTEDTTTSTGSTSDPTTSSGDNSASDQVAGTTTTPAATLYRVPLTLEVSGSYFELEQFVNKLEGFKRSFLVTGFTLAEAAGTDAAPGDLTLSLQGRVFLSPEVAPATDTQPTAPTAVAPDSE